MGHLKPDVAPLFKPAILDEYRDVKLLGARLLDIFEHVGTDSPLDWTSPEGNRIVVTGKVSQAALRNTTLYFDRGNNRITLDSLGKVSRLHIACVRGSQVSIGTPVEVRGMTVMCSDRSKIEIGTNCMISRDVTLYSSNAHALYNVSDGVRRSGKGIFIGNHVWLGQGVKILNGAHVGDGTVIGSYSVLAGKVPNNCAAAGNPCRVTTRDIFWLEQAKGAVIQSPEAVPFARLTDAERE